MPARAGPCRLRPARRPAVRHGRSASAWRVPGMATIRCRSRSGRTTGAAAGRENARPKPSTSWRRARCPNMADKPDRSGERQRGGTRGADERRFQRAVDALRALAERPVAGGLGRSGERGDGIGGPVDIGEEVQGGSACSRHAAPEGRSGAASDGRPTRIPRHRTERRRPIASSGPSARRRSRRRRPAVGGFCHRALTRRSSTVTATPDLARSIAAARPPAPAPITVTCGVRIRQSSTFGVDYVSS